MIRAVTHRARAHCQTQWTETIERMRGPAPPGSTSQGWISCAENPTAMHLVAVVLALASALLGLGYLAESAATHRLAGALERAPTPSPHAAPGRVSIVVAVRNEAQGIEPALRSLLAGSSRPRSGRRR